MIRFAAKHLFINRHFSTKFNEISNLVKVSEYNMIEIRWYLFRKYFLACDIFCIKNNRVSM